MSAQAPDPFMRLMRGMMTLVGAIFALVGIGLLVREINFSRTAISARGMVASVRRTESSDSVNYIPVVEFTDRNEKHVQFDGMSTSPAPVQGQVVNVLYNPDHPNDARVDTFVDRWMFPAIFTPIGLILLFFGVVRRNRVPNAELPEVAQQH